MERENEGGLGRKAIKRFRAENRNERVRILAGRQAPSLEKMAGISSMRLKVGNFICFPNFPGRSNNLASVMESRCIVFVGN